MTLDDFKQIKTKFEGMEAIVVLPEKSNGKQVLKTEYFGAFAEVEAELIKRGFTLIHVRNTNRWGTEDNVDRQAAFIKHTAKEYNLSEKTVLVGMSCGGMEAVYLAAKYPELVSVMYLDAPVMNFCSCPADFVMAKSGFWDEFYSVCKISKPELLMYRNHPIDKIPVLTENKIPVIMVYGEDDLIVPYKENGIALERAYRENNIPLEVYGKENCSHHPHGLSDSTIIADFISKYA